LTVVCYYLGLLLLVMSDSCFLSLTVAAVAAVAVEIDGVCLLLLTVATD